MDRKDKLQIKGNVNLKHFRKGKLIEERNAHNTIQTPGIEALGDYIIGTFTGDFNYMGIGLNTGLQGDTPALTLLDSEVGENGVAGVVHHIMSSRTSAAGVVELVCTFLMTGSALIKECGIFSATPSGTMLARQQFAVLSLVATDSLQITWTITIVDT